ncbi:unnamed protein product, partial [Brenthis ino]
MDNPLTPNKIQRLMHLAEDKSFNLARRTPINNDDMKSSIATSHVAFNKTGTNYESSSGILDLERVEGFGESGISNISLSKSTAFNPGEMTGRSTGTEDADIKALIGAPRAFEEYGRHSVALDSITSNMDKQTSEINDIMRHSIATNYSFHSKRDLTADEASLVMREAPLPIQHNTQANFQDSIRTERSRAEKRNRVVDEGEVWTEVGRRGKVVARSASDDDMTRVPEEQIEISMTSKKEKLPKQLGLARILKQENILDIIRYERHQEDTLQENLPRTTQSDNNITYAEVLKTTAEVHREQDTTLNSNASVFNTKKKKARKDQEKVQTDEEYTLELDSDIDLELQEREDIQQREKFNKFDEKIHIAVLSETWLNSNVNFRISGYNIVREDRDDGYGGVAIIVHASIKYQLSKINCTNPGIQLIHLKLLNCFQIENIIAIYCPPSVQTTTSDWDYIFGIYNNKTLIAGDFNAHHSNWSYKTDNRGSQLFDVLLDKNYITLNDGSPTRIKLVNGSLQKSSPDITLVTSDIALKFTWAMSNESLGSDHLIIKYSLYNNNQSPNFVRKRNFKKANWNGYSSFLQSIFSVLILAANPQKAYNQFVDAINTAANIYIPPVNICQDPLRLKKFVPKSYWNVDISRSIAERRLALAIFRKNPTPHNLSNLQAKIASARRTIRKAKREAWRKFCSSINEIVSLSEMCRRMRWLKGYRLPRANIDETIANKLLRNLSPDYVSPDKPSFTSSNQALESIITLHELNRAIKNKDTAPGDDSISFSMIKYLPVNGKEILIQIYNMILASGYVPSQWRKTSIIPIPKTGSLSQLLMSSFNMSVGAYFKNRCPEFGRILGHSDSPDRANIADVSSITQEITQGNANNNHTYKIDQTLDSVPVRQPKTERTYEKVVTNLFPTDVNDVILMPKPQTMDVSRTTFNKSAVTKGPVNIPQKLNQSNHKFTSSKPTDILLRNLHSSLRPATDDTECSTENSLSISKIADYLGKQSNVSVTDILQLNNHTKQVNRKQPLTELHMNVLDNNKPNQELYVTHLKDTKEMETASSSGTVHTVISLDKLKISDDKNDIPSVIVTRHSVDSENVESEDVKMYRAPRSNTPSTKSHSTLSTVQEVPSFKSNDSPLHSSNEQWADIVVSPVEGFVGVSTAVFISVTTLTNSWLTAKFEFDNIAIKNDFTIELPRLPLLLSPGKTEKFLIHITSNIEFNSYLPFTMYLKDTSIDDEIIQKGHIEISIKTPTIQALSCDGVNIVNFPPIQEKSSMTKYFVLISDCPVDLQLELSISEGDSMFVIKSVQEIKKNDVSKALMERQGSTEDGQVKKTKTISKQLCRLSSGNAIKVSIIFNAPKLSELELNERNATFKGTLNVNLIGIDTILKNVSLIGTVGSVNLVLQASSNKLHLTNETTKINLCNTGTIGGIWAVKFKSNSSKDGQFPFRVSATKLDIPPGGVKEMSLVYTGPSDVLSEGTLILEDTANGNITTIDIVGGSDKPKTFPIKTNFNNMSWVRAGRKELSLKNSTNRKVQIRCQIVGEGFKIDAPGYEMRGTFILSFGPCECRPLPIIFSPNSCMPYAAALHLVFDKSNEFSRKVKLHGCAGGGGARWAGLVTYGRTALLRAPPHAPLDLALYNKAPAPVFVCAAVQFNLQYRFLSEEAELVGARRVVPRRAQHVVSLRVPWPRLQRRARAGDACALAAVHVLTAPELTRRRILRILRDETTGELDLSLLPDHLRVLAEPLEGEDPAIDTYLENFSETKASLNELIESIHELTAQIDVPQDFEEDNTILISDDTVVEHHTLCD